MKTYKYLYKAILILLLLSSYLTHSQIRPSEFFKRQWLDLDSDASLGGNSLDETLDDFSFNWDYNYNTAFNNLVLLEQAKLDKLESWYRKQYNLIQDEIEKQLNTSFSSYDQAKKAFFSDIEGKNITRNTPVLLSKYKKLYNPGRNKNRKYLKELRHLQLREIEIRAGNRNNSQFPYLQAKGVSLKGVTSLSKLSELKYDLENAFGNQISKNHEYVYIIEKLDYLGSDFDKEMLNLKNKFYKSFDKWDQLGLMQYLLNYEYYKDILRPPYSIPDELVEFQFSDMATEPVIEEYAKNNRGGGVSLFDPRYPEINRYLYQNNFCGGYIDLMAWEADKQAALDGYIDNVSTHRIIASNLIQELNITNQNQIHWLNSYTYKNDLNNLSNFMQNYRVNGVVPAEVKEFVMEFLNIIEEIPTAKFRRYEELMELIKDDPFVLLEDCIQQNGLDIVNYQQLYDHTLPQSCKNRLDNLGSDFQDQPLNTGNAAVANVDYYSVEITTNPDFNLDGMPDSDAEVYNAYKNKFTDLASGNKDDFQFSCNIPLNTNNKADISWTFSPYYSVDATTWNSNNPLAAIIEIIAWGDVNFSDLVSDDGAIMISAFTPQYWIGSTIQTFRTKSQPFSGNRQWGYLTNQNGNLELYARAVDVARVDNLTLFGPGTDECKEETYYNIGDATWSNLQEEIKYWVNAYNGKASIVPKTAVHFDKNKLKELLESNDTINQINCN
jgi:hypothetical protein